MPLATIQANIPRVITDRRNWSSNIRALGGLSRWWSTVRGMADIDGSSGEARILPRDGFGSTNLVTNGPIVFGSTGLRPWQSVAGGNFAREVQLEASGVYSFLLTSRCTVNFAHAFSIACSTWGTTAFTLRPSHSGSPALTKGSSALFRDNSLQVPLNTVSTIGLVVDCTNRRVSMALNGGAFVTSDLMTGTDLVVPTAPVSLTVGALNAANVFSGDLMEIAVGASDLRTNAQLWQQFRAYATEIWGNP